MAKIKPDTAFAAAVLDGFPGVDLGELHCGTKSADSMVNFRPNADGSIGKRCGYGHVITFPSVPRAVFSGYLDGEEVFYFLSHGSVFTRCEDDEYGYEYVGSVDTEEGDAAFVEFLGRLYLFDGNDVYVLEDGLFKAAEGYIPLYAKNWDPVSRGEIYERDNLLTRRVRLHYLNTQARETVSFGRRVLSIHRVWLDGVEVAKTDVTLETGGLSCTSNSFIAADEIELLVTLDGDLRGRVTGATRALVYGGAQNNRLLAWGGTDANAFYYSSAVSIDRAEESDADGETSGGALYFPNEASYYRVHSPVTAVARYFDRLLIFTASGAWAGDSSGNGELTVMPIHSAVGCDKRDAAVLCGDHPVTYCGGKLWRWSVKSTSQNAYAAEELSLPVAAWVAEMREREVLLYYCRERSELLLAFPGDEDGRVLVYHPDYKRFYTFEGIYADRFVDSPGEAMFLSDLDLLQFDASLTHDYGDVPIKATYRSGWLDFGHPERTKHLLRFFLLADPDGEALTVRFENERGRCAAVDLFGKGDTPLCTYDRRVSCGRFRFLRVSFTAGGASRARLKHLTVTARK